jgi:hypothetical protein
MRSPCFGISVETLHLFKGLLNPLIGWFCFKEPEGWSPVKETIRLDLTEHKS